MMLVKIRTGELLASSEMMKEWKKTRMMIISALSHNRFSRTMNWFHGYIVILILLKSLNSSSICLQNKSFSKLNLNIFRHIYNKYKTKTTIQMIMAPSDLLLDVVCLINVLTDLLTYLHTSDSYETARALYTDESQSTIPS